MSGPHPSQGLHIRFGRIVGAELARVAGRSARSPVRDTRPAPAPHGTPQWARDLLSLTEAQATSRILIHAAWKTRLQTCHPDAGGSDEAAQDAGVARDILLAQLEA